MPSPALRARLRIVLIRALVALVPLLAGLWWDVRSGRIVEDRARAAADAELAAILRDARTAVGRPADAAALRALLDDAGFRALVALTPPVAPTTLGNPDPFTSTATGAPSP